MSWFIDINGNELPPTEPQELTARDLVGLGRMGFPDMAQRLAAGRCSDCGFSRTGPLHQRHCVQFAKPLPVREVIRQPWEPRPPRVRLAA